MLALLRKDGVMKVLDRRSYFAPGIPWMIETGEALQAERINTFVMTLSLVMLDDTNSGVRSIFQRFGDGTCSFPTLQPESLRGRPWHQRRGQSRQKCFWLEHWKQHAEWS